jgi:hypothetical protein
MSYPGITNAGIQIKKFRIGIGIGIRRSRTFLEPTIGTGSICLKPRINARFMKGMATG